MMAANTGERTLAPAILPPGSAHIHGISAAGSHDDAAFDLAVGVAGLSSILVDFSLRSAPKATIQFATLERLPSVHKSPLAPSLGLRSLRLNALTSAYAPLWNAAYRPDFSLDSWTDGSLRDDRPPLGATSREWTPDVPLRRAIDRRQALIEIDALVALALGITAEELCTIYRTQFPVMAGYDRTSYLYDANGRVVPTSLQQVWRRRGDGLNLDERTVEHPGSGVAYTYELPFRVVDRETDLRQAYEEFVRRFPNSS